MKLVNLKNFQPVVDTSLSCDIFVKASEVKFILIFKKDMVLNAEDLTRCKKYNDMNCIFVKEEDYFSIFKKETTELKASLDKGGEINTRAGATISRNFFRSEELLSSDNKLESMVNIANNFVVDLLSSSKEQRSIALMEMLKNLNVTDDLFINHANQVAAISTMIALMVENVTMDNIIEINLVSILHGMGLMLASNEKNDFFSRYADVSEFKESIGKTDLNTIKKVIDKHFDGHNKLTTSDNVIFLQHLSLVEQNIDKIKIKNIKSQSILKTIGDFKLILGATETSTPTNNPYLSAKILVVGDRLVSLMNYYKKNPTFIEASIKALLEINESPKPIFDKKIMAKISLMMN